jgi:FlgN protein.
MTEAMANRENTAPDPARLATALVGLMRSLAETMEDEMDCLNKNDMAGVENLRETKARLVRDYNTNVKLLAQKPDYLRDAPEDMRTTLRVYNNRLEDATQRNAAALRSAIGATQRLIETIVDAARHEIKKNDVYTDPRKMTNVLGSYSPTCVPVAVNRTA